MDLQQEADIQGATIEDVRRIFDTLAPVTVAAPLDEEDVKNRVASATQHLDEESKRNESLLYSSIIVFEQQRYYDVSRLYLYADQVYEKLTTDIHNSSGIEPRVKKALGVFSDVGFPRTISIDEPPESVKVGVFDRQTYIEVEINIRYFTGKFLTFITRFQC